MMASAISGGVGTPNTSAYRAAISTVSLCQLAFAPRSSAIIFAFGSNGLFHTVPGAKRLAQTKLRALPGTSSPYSSLAMS